MVATHVRRKGKRDQRDKSSIAYETAHTKEKVDVHNKWECEKSMAENSRFAERHTGRIYWTAYIVKECLLGLSRVTSLDDRVVTGCFISSK